jgi:hypothetical protein
VAISISKAILPLGFWFQTPNLGKRFSASRSSVHHLPQQTNKPSGQVYSPYKGFKGQIEKAAELCALLMFDSSIYEIWK